MQNIHSDSAPLANLPFPLIGYTKQEMPLGEMINSGGDQDPDITCELDEIEEFIKSRELQLNAAKIEVQAAQEDARTSKLEAETLRKQVDELQKLLSFRADNFENAIKSTDELKSQVGIQEKQLEELRQELLQTRANHTKASTELRAFKQQATEAGVELEQARADKQRLEKLASESKAFADKALHLDSQMQLNARQHAHQVESLERKLEDALFQIESLTTARPGFGNVVTQLQNEIASLQRENELLKNSIQTVHQETVTTKPIELHMEQLNSKASRGRPRRTNKEKVGSSRPTSIQPSLAMITSKSTAFASGELPDLDF